MNILTRDLDYEFGGVQMRGHFAIAAGPSDPRPGVVIFPDAFGLDAYCIGVADRLAGMGYAALACDLWGGRQTVGLAEGGPMAAGLMADPASWMGRASAGQQALVAQPGVDAGKVAALGYCLGGSTVLEMARTGAALRGVVSFHGALDFVGPDWDASKVSAKLLVCTGIEDPLVPWKAVTDFQDQVRRGGVNWEMDIYSQAKHSFTRPDAAERSSPDRVGYDPQAARRSWRAATDLLEEVLLDKNLGSAHGPG